LSSAPTDLSAERALIEAAYRESQRSFDPDAPVALAVRAVVAALDRGEIRVAEKIDGAWVTHAWIKEAILLFFGLQKMERIELPPFEYHDKIPLKHGLDRAGVRVVPPGVARYGSFLERGAILMPGYVNIGARVGAGSMVDTWATVGSCAQIGSQVHLAGGVGIGGVLEPPAASPVIVEDHVFVGSRCVLVEGVLVEEGAVLGANVVITGSTPILDVSGSEEKVHRGRVPANSVVIPGSRPRQFPAGTYQIPCPLIIGTRHAGTDRKTSLNQALRDFQIQA
jgi:2,3,4,5-tetrahydropyridine-2-carboxylate N-succinyltransferase